MNILLTINSTILFVFFYLVKEKICVFSISTYWGERGELVINSVAYLLVIGMFTIVCLNIITYFGRKNSEKLEQCSEIEYADNSFLPSYLGYFFIALSLPSVENDGWLLFVITYILLFVFTAFSRTMYYNPLFLLSGYKFYNVTNLDGVRIILITKRSLKRKMLTPVEVYRLNDYAYFEINKTEKEK